MIEDAGSRSEHRPLRGAINVESLGADDASDVEAFLTSVDDSLLYYSTAYGGFLSDLLACEVTLWGVRESGNLTGVLPLAIAVGPWGSVVNSLPYYGSNGGALATTRAARLALASQFDKVAAEPDVVTATWIEHPLRSAVVAPVTHDLVDQRLGMFTDLTAGADSLWGRIDGSARRNVGKAEHGGVTVRIDNGSVDFLERVHVETMSAIGGRPKSPAFFATFQRHFVAGRDYNIYVADRDGRPAAALLLLYFHRTVEYFTPVTVSTEREHQPMAAILWKALRDSIDAGYQRWNWGGTWTTQDGVARFKRKWAAESYPYRYYTRIRQPGILERTPGEILAAYPDVYVVPFDRLRASSGSREDPG